jgi:hypothetical protein
MKALFIQRDPKLINRKPKNPKVFFGFAMENAFYLKEPEVAKESRGWGEGAGLKWHRLSSLRNPWPPPANA